MLSSFVITLIPKSNRLLISWLQSPSAVIWEPPKIKSLSFHCFPIYLPWSDGPRYHDLSFLSFKPTFSLFSFTFIKRLFSFSLLSAIRVVSSAYLRLLIGLLAILIPACASSSLTFHMMYSEYKLNKQSDRIQPWHIPFPIWNQFVLPCPVLTVALILTCIQISQEECQVVWYSHLLKNFPQFIVNHIVKGFHIVNKAEVDVFVELSCFFNGPGCWQYDLWFLCLF